MKLKLLSILTSLLIAPMALFGQQDFDLNLEVTQNDNTNSGTLKVKVYIKATSTAFDIGTSSIRVFYNDAALTYASYSATSYSGFVSPGFYTHTASSSTQTGRDILAISVVLANSPTGNPVPTTWTELGEVTFTIADVTAAKSLTFGPINGGSAGETVVLSDDNTTANSAGGELWDHITWNGSAWFGGNGTSEAPNSTDGVKSLTISSGTAAIGDLVHIDSLVISGGATLNLNVSGSDQGHLFVTSNNASVSGTFNINASSDGYAQYIGPAVSATVDQYVGSSAGWRHLGFPVNGNASTLSGVTIDYTSSATTANMYSFNTSTFAWNAVSTNTTTPGANGVSVYMGGANFPVTNSVVTWTGTTNSAASSATYNFASSPTGDAAFDGWNLIANPYPTNIDWHTVDAQQSGIFASYSIYDANTNSYASYSEAGGSSGSFTVTRYVAPGQSVWMKTSTDDNGKTLAIANADRTFTGGQTFVGDFKTNATGKGTEDRIKLNVANDVSGYNDATVVFFNGSTAYEPQFDAHKPTNLSPAPNFYSQATTGEDLSINGYGSFDPSIIVPVSFENDQYDAYTISMEMADVDPTWGDVYLYDHFTGTIHNLTQDGDYKFTHYVTAPKNRFQIQFVSSAVGLAENTVSDMNIYSFESTVAVSRPNPAGNLTVALYNLAGQKVFEDEFGSNKLIEFTTGLPTAYYIVKARDESGVAQSETIIIQ